MTNILISIAVLIMVALLAYAVSWYLARGRRTASASSGHADSTNPTQIGVVTGMMGGDIKDAAVNQYAMQHKEGATGQPATTEDAVKVAAMQRAMKP